MVRVSVAFSLAAALALAGCKTDNMADGVKSAGSAVVDGAKDVAGAGASLVNVNLSNVLNDLALDLKVDKSNIPINAQIPITVAANVCGVSINILPSRGFAFAQARVRSLWVGASGTSRTWRPCCSLFLM